MRATNLEQYKRFLEEKGNFEEREALAVVKELVSYHTEGTKLRLVDLQPHLWVEGEGERFEIDLLLTLASETKYQGRRFRAERKIAVEFKESDIKRVISQAVTRKPYVDYVYIATRSWVTLDYYDLFVMGYYGIGWVIWDKDFAKIIVPAKFHAPVHALEYLVEDAVRRHLEKALSKMNAKVTEKSILDFVGDESG